MCQPTIHPIADFYILGSTAWGFLWRMLKQATQAEIKQLRQNAIAESMAMQIGADNYADDVLSDVERRLQQMLEIIQNGRQQLN